MSKFEEYAGKISKTLDLKWEPIAIKFSNSADNRGESTRKLRVCEAFDVVRRENTIINLSEENCVCPGGRHFLGLEILPLEAIAAVWTKAHKAYQSLDTAMASVGKQPQPIKRGDFAILSPLRKTDMIPDLILLFANSKQADRIIGLASFEGAEPFTYYPISNICSSVTNALAKGHPEINFLTVHARQWADWSPDELIVTLPFPDFEVAINNIPRSGFGTAQMEAPRP